MLTDALWTNDSYNDYGTTDFYQRNRDAIPRWRMTGRINTAFTLLFFVIGLPWNALVIGIIVKKKLFTPTLCDAAA